MSVTGGVLRTMRCGGRSWIISRSATHIGLTATPKETKYVSNVHYFGEPVYVYSLKQGIEDGFLAPYRVYRIDLDKDLQGWRPTRGQKDKYGNEIEDRIYNQKDFDRSLVLEHRTELVARKISDFLKNTGRYDKTIVFCENIDHAERMRQYLVNENADLVKENGRYIVRITGDSPEGKAELDNFIMPDSKYPVIATTSKLMGTGVDAQTCKLIVIDKRIESMSEFKQIIGRGTRINEDYNKFFFTIMDFRKVSELFADPDFDGEPLDGSLYDPTDPIAPPQPKEREPSGAKRYVVNDVPVTVVAERVQYYGSGWEADHRVAGGLHEEERDPAVRDPECVPDFVDKGGAEDGDPGGTGGAGRSLRGAAGAGGEGLRSLRPDLPRGLRPAAHVPEGAGCKGAEGELLHEVRRAGAEGAGCPPVEIFRWRDRRYREHGGAAGGPVHHIRHPAGDSEHYFWRERQLSGSSTAAGAVPLHGRVLKGTIRKELIFLWQSEPRSRRSRTSCGRMRVSMATPSGSASSAGCSS